MYTFVLWGYGKRGKRFMQMCPAQHVITIIDRACVGRSTEDNIPIIDYEEYKKNYDQYDIVIAVDDNLEICEKLKKDGYYRYHLLEDCPPEYIGFGGGRWFPDLPIHLNTWEKYIIYGLNVYTILLRDYLLEKYCLKNISIIPENIDERSCAFSQKYEFITEPSNITDEVILWGSRYDENRCLYKNAIEMFDFSDDIVEYRHTELNVFKNKYKGEGCFIIATGPSLTKQDLDLLYHNNCISFGVNRIYLSFNSTQWRPDYLVVADDKIMNTYYEEILSCDVHTKFIGDLADYNETRENIYKLHDHVIEYYPELPKFSDDIEKKVYSGRTVVYTCIQIACYMGFERIYLLGTDHNYSTQQSDTTNHFHKDYYKGDIKPDKYVGVKAELAYKAAKQYCDLRGIKIYNATRGGKLEVFERKSLEQALKEEREYERKNSECDCSDI